MTLTKKRLKEIKAFKNTDFSDCPEMTDGQLAQLKPSHYRNMANYKPIKKTVNVDLEAHRSKDSLLMPVRLNVYKVQEGAISPV
jgi:hypothetical protein